KALAQCGPNNYAYFIEKATDDPLVRKIEFAIEGVEPTMDGMALHATSFYVPGFDPNINYVVVDNFGKEHPVVNRTPQLAYRPFIEDGKVWKVGSGFANPVQDVRYYYFDGDTVIDGKTCKRMMCQQYVSPESLVNELHYSLSYAGAWYEEDKKVYTYDEDNKEFKLMYDFSAGKNDTLTVTRDHQDYQYVIGPKQSGDLKGFKGVYRNIRWIDEGSIIYSPTWLEGVGSIDSPVNSFYFGYVDPLSFLMSCVVGDEVIYLDDTYVDGATPESAISEKRRFDFTHTIKTRPKAPLHRLAEASETTSLYGEYSDQRLGINLNPLDQAYLVSITDMSGKAVYEKTVDAGTIVALDIDISAYPKGHYTVTVENSNEVFTGEFDSQTEGIEVVSNKKTEGANIIFNLQGQRISSLQKGLNIVSGRKVYMR
ncbi:MAG: T9SS type A sorting domain-containing protein, partial [Prevotella sp.]|nr:T9SS type A sorting domain-containing protein [Prevotella sp.]